MTGCAGGVLANMDQDTTHLHLNLDTVLLLLKLCMGPRSVSWKIPSLYPKPLFHSDDLSPMETKPISERIVQGIMMYQSKEKYTKKSGQINHIAAPTVVINPNC